jgi:3-oxoadipate enol-lactonase
MSAAPAAAMRRLAVPGAELAYRFDGAGEGAPVVLLAHGILTDHRIWDGVTERLGRSMRVLRYDLRGHGQSSCGGPYTMERLADDVPALLDALGLQQVHLVGASLGGMLAQQVAARHGERLVSLTLANTAAVQPAAAAWQERIDSVRRAGNVNALAEPTLQRWFTPRFREAAPGQVERVRDILCATPAEGYIGCAGAVRDLAQLDLLRQIRVPTLVVAGAHDEATPPTQSAQLCAGIADARLATLNAAHQAAFEQPDAFCTAWIDFVGRSASVRPRTEH